jgi:hypothetical protein
MTYDQVYQIMAARCPGDDIVITARLSREIEIAVQARDASRNLGLDRRAA